MSAILCTCLLVALALGCVLIPQMPPQTLISVFKNSAKVDTNGTSSAVQLKNEPTQQTAEGWRFFDKCDTLLLDNNRPYFECFKPVMAYVDPNNTYQWQHQSLLSIAAVIPCIYNLLPDVYLSYYKTAKYCEELVNWSNCLADNLGSTDTLKCLPFAYFQEAIKTVCVNNIAPVYRTCHEKVNRTGWLMSKLRPMSQCQYQDSETLSAELRRLTLLDFYMWHLPDYPNSHGDWRPGSISARIYCKQLQLFSCFERRMQMWLCPSLAYLNLTRVLRLVYGSSRRVQCATTPRCQQFTRQYCAVDVPASSVTLTVNVADTTPFYNSSNRAALTAALLHTASQLLAFDVTHVRCDARNLLFKQAGCFYKTLALLDVTRAVEVDYLRGYFTEHLPAHDACWRVYAGACRGVVDDLSYVSSFISEMVELITMEVPVTCPMQTLTAFSEHDNLSGVIATSFKRFLGLFSDATMLMGIEKNSRVGDGFTVKLLSLYQQTLFTVSKGDFQLYPVYKEMCGEAVANIAFGHFVNVTDAYPAYNRVLKDTVQYLIAKHGSRLSLTNGYYHHIKTNTRL